MPPNNCEECGKRKCPERPCNKPPMVCPLGGQPNLCHGHFKPVCAKCRGIGEVSNDYGVTWKPCPDCKPMKVEITKVTLCGPDAHDQNCDGDCRGKEEKQNNYLQTGPFHCFTCHKNFDGIDDRCLCVPNTTPCTKDCTYDVPTKEERCEMCDEPCQTMMRICLLCQGGNECKRCGKEKCQLKSHIKVTEIAWHKKHEEEYCHGDCPTPSPKRERCPCVEFLKYESCANTQCWQAGYDKGWEQRGKAEPVMGVSQWLEHGKKYGYDTYFIDQAYDRGLAAGQQRYDELHDTIPKLVEKAILSDREEHHCRGCSGLDKPGAFDVAANEKYEE